MTVTSRDIKEPRKRIDWSMLLARVAVGLALTCFGGIFWAVNGGFSVLGVQVAANAFNDAGRIFWAIVSQWRFPVPAVPGLPASQPVIPWIGVVAATIIQIVIVFRRLRRLSLPRWLIATALLLSAYDLASTYYGLGTVAWVASGGFFVQSLLTILLTFTIEIIIGAVLKELLP